MDSIVHQFTVVDTTIDIILFQEVFHPKRRKQLIEGMKHSYPYYTPVINSAKGRPFKTNSGLVVFSKTPIYQMESIKFNDCSGSDCMAFKGAQFVHTVWNSTPLLIVNTHLNSEPPRSIALEQTKLIISELVEPFSEKQVPIILGGDFNINCNDQDNYDQLLSIVESKNSVHTDNTQKTIQGLQNTLDYLFVYKDWLPDSFSLDYVQKILIGPTWDNSGKRKIYGKTVGFSDHHPVLMQLIYTP